MKNETQQKMSQVGNENVWGPKQLKHQRPTSIVAATSWAILAHNGTFRGQVSEQMPQEGLMCELQVPMWLKSVPEMYQVKYECLQTVPKVPDEGWLQTWQSLLPPSPLYILRSRYPLPFVVLLVHQPLFRLKLDKNGLLQLQDSFGVRQRPQSKNFFW